MIFIMPGARTHARTHEWQVYASVGHTLCFGPGARRWRVDTWTIRGRPYRSVIPMRAVSLCGTHNVVEIVVRIPAHTYGPTPYDTIHVSSFAA